MVKYVRKSALAGEGGLPLRKTEVTRGAAQRLDHYFAAFEFLLLLLPTTTTSTTKTVREECLVSGIA